MLPKKEYNFMQNNLKSMGFSNYTEYLGSEWWMRKVESIFKFNERKCQICGSKKRISIHHLTYEHLGNEPMKDLMILCKPCHEHEHNKCLLIGDLMKNVQCKRK